MIWQKSKTRLFLFLAIALLAALLVVSGNSVLTRLHELSTAQSDNTQWTISQAETELAEFSAVLADAIAAPDFDQTAVRLQADLALSRLSILQSGRVRSLLSTSATAVAHLQNIQTYFDQTAEIIDTSPALSKAEYQTLRRATDAVKDDVRQLAVEGVILSEAETEARRERVLAQLKLTGGTLVILISILATLLIFLDRLLARARERDAAIRSYSDQLGSTVAASLDAIIVADDAGKIIEFNQSAEQIFGWPRAEILGQSMASTIVPTAHRAAHAHGMKRFLSTGKKHVVDGGRVELTALRKNGEEFPIELNITSVKAAQGTTFIAYLRDISDRKKNEASLIEARDQAERADKAKSRFLAVMSHEMRTPLNGILGVLDLMRSGKLNERQARYVDIATASSEILLEHVNEALDITRIESGEHVLSVQSFDLLALVDGVVDVLRPLAEEKGLKFSVQTSGARHWGYRGDNLRVRQILTNILGNAIKFTQAGEITLRLKQLDHEQPGLLQLSVQDTGPGIATQDIDRVFDDFVELGHRAEGRQMRGDGLGLSISRRIARQMEGDLTVKSAVGQGSTFTLTLPLLKADITETAEAADAQNITPASQGLRVLVVEDNATNRTVLRDMLERLGHIVSKACDGLEAVKAASEHLYDVILMDLSMPNLDGTGAAKRIRSAVGKNDNTPIFAITAHGADTHKMHIKAAGMNGIIAKPIRLATLQELLNTAHHWDAGDKPSGAVELNVTPLADLVSAIGVAKVSAALDRFFDEFDAEIHKLSPGGENAEEPARGQAIHKMRGAAVMFGFDQISDDLAALDGHPPTVQQVEAIYKTAGAQRASAEAYLREHSQEPP